MAQQRRGLPSDITGRRISLSHHDAPEYGSRHQIKRQLRIDGLRQFTACDAALQDLLCLWNAGDFERTLPDFQAYFNAASSRASLEGHKPLTFAGDTRLPVPS
jgi:hypothetical protein